MNKKTSRFGTMVLLGAISAVIAVALMMFGAKFGLWEPIFGFGLVRTYMNPIGYVITGLGLLGLIFQLITRNAKGIFKTFLAMFLGVCLLAPLIKSKLNPQKRQPPINDITTDTSNPPAFIVLDDTRAGAKNSLVYGGAKIAAIQKKLFPEIAPVETTKSPADAFAEAVRVAKEMGWEIIAKDTKALRFEATASTSVYSFKDDVVVVVAAVGEGSRIDIRSISRVGRGDRGVNAARVKAFIAAFAD